MSPSIAWSTSPIVKRVNGTPQTQASLPSFVITGCDSWDTGFLGWSWGSLSR